MHVFLGISELNANNGDPAQTQASDLGLHWLPMSLLWNAKLIWVNQIVPSETALPQLS